ncbi:g5083 [Coccomyxa viridis]|uniref:G5083 protein n=1 Tax=Coccomyxa viridis TaxID=1274662 RepID=A0ABP1FRX5_9CHLO
MSVDIKAELMGLTPRSLACERAVEQPAPGVEESWFRRTLLTIGGFYSRESRLIRGAKVLYNDIVEQATNKDFYKAFGLEYRFATTYSLLCLHVWLALVRLRAEGKDGKDLAQMMYDNFQEDVEIRVRGEGVKVRVGKWLTDLEKNFYGSSLAYDKALKGEGELSEAIFRNVYGMEDGRRKQAEAMARYVQRELACFAMTDSDAVMSGKVKFSTEFLDGN